MGDLIMHGVRGTLKKENVVTTLQELVVCLNIIYLGMLGILIKFILDIA